MSLNVEIQWCGSCGYKQKFEAAKKDLKSKFGGSIHVISIRDEDTTQNFNVKVAGSTVYDKKLGHGSYKSNKERIYEAILSNLNRDGTDVQLILNDEEVDDGGEKKSLCISIFTLLVSIPALIGACCWPALVVAAVSGSVTSAARSLGHIISLLVTGCMMLLVTLFMAWSLKKRDASKGTWVYYGPLILVCIATPLILADSIRHVLQDQGVWEECNRDPDVMWSNDCFWASNQFKCNKLPPHCVPDSEENMFHLSPMGILFTIIFTYTGFICLMMGTLWNANICQKITELKEQWREIRGVGGVN